MALRGMMMSERPSSAEGSLRPVRRGKPKKRSSWPWRRSPCYKPSPPSRTLRPGLLQRRWGCNRPGVVQWRLGSPWYRCLRPPARREGQIPCGGHLQGARRAEGAVRGQGCLETLDPGLHAWRIYIAVDDDLRGRNLSRRELLIENKERLLGPNSIGHGGDAGETVPEVEGGDGCGDEYASG